MKRLLKIVGIVVGIPVLGLVGLVVWFLVESKLYELPADTPRVVETASYRFEAPDGWITSCATEAAGCLAVATSRDIRIWANRTEWLEVQNVDATGVVDTQSFGLRATQAAYELVGADPASAEVPAELPDAIEGTEIYSFTSGGGEGFMGTKFVRFPSGEITRFTCHAKDDSHAEACSAALDRIHFPVAAAFVAAREEEQRQAEAAAAAAAEAAEAERLARVRQANEDQFAQLDNVVRDIQTSVAQVNRSMREANRRAWRGPGWYRLWQSPFSSPTIDAGLGPYPSAADCLASIPADGGVDEDGDTGQVLGCGELNTTPDF